MQERTEDARIAGILMDRERWGRTMQWDAKREAAVAALTPQQISDAFKRYVDASAISIRKGGDFKKAGAFQ